MLFVAAVTARATTPLAGALTWRTLLPDGGGEYAPGARFTNPEDGAPYVKLISDSGTATIHPSIYSVVLANVVEPEFRIYPGNDTHVAIRSSGSVVGGIAQVKL